MRIYKWIGIIGAVCAFILAFNLHEYQAPLGVVGGLCLIGVIYLILSPYIDAFLNPPKPSPLGPAVQAYVAKAIGQKERPFPLKDRIVETIPYDLDSVVEYHQQRYAQNPEVDWTTYITNMTGQDQVAGFGDPLVRAYVNYVNALPKYISDKGLPILTRDVPHSKAMKEFYWTFNYQGSPYYIAYTSYNDTYQRVKKETQAKIYDWDSPRFYDELTHGYFSYMFTPDTPLKVEIPKHLWFEGCWVLAPKGRGKTTLLSNLLDIHLEEVRDGKASIIVMDVKGELTQLKHSARFGRDGDLWGKLIFIDPWEDLALNPLQLGSEQDAPFFMRYLLNSLMDSDTSQKMSGVLTKVVLAARKVPDATLETLLKILVDWKPYEKHIKQLKDPTYFTKGLYDAPDNKKTRESLYWRIDTFLDEVPRMRSMLTASTNLVDLAPWMNEGKVIVINNSNSREDGIGGGASFFSRYFLMQILDAGENRKGNELPVYLYFDEADKIIGQDELAAEIINRLRSRKVGLIAAHQSISQIENEKVKSALEDCSIIFVNPQSDAAKVQHLLKIPAKDLQNYERGEFAMYLYDQPGMPLKVRLDIPGRHISTWPKMSIEDFSEYRALMRRMFCIPKKEKVPDPDSTDTTPKKRKG